LRYFNFGEPKKIRFCKPLDHHATRPGFQAPWGSHDPHARPRMKRVFFLTFFWVGVSIAANQLIEHYMLNQPSSFSRTKEWFEATEERERKLQGGA